MRSPAEIIARYAALRAEVGPDVTVVELSGRMTLGRDSQRVESMLSNLLTEGCRKLIIDLSRVNYVDSSGVGLIAYCANKAGQLGAQLRVAGTSGMVLDVFHMTRVDLVVPFCADVAAAIASVNGEAGMPA